MKFKSGLARRNPGFSLIELLVTIAIAGVLLAIAVPSMTQFLDSTAIRSACSELTDSIGLARAEGIRRSAPINQLVYFGRSCSGTYNDGWMVFLDADGDKCYGTGDTLITRSNPPSRGVTVASVLTNSSSTSVGYIGFNGAGLTRESGSNNFVSGSFTCSIAGSSAPQITVTISALGRVRQSAI